MFNVIWGLAERKKRKKKKQFEIEKMLRMEGSKYISTPGHQKGEGSEIFLSKNNQVGLTQGGGYMIPPPQKVVGLKLCWIVVSFA